MKIKTNIKSGQSARADRSSAQVVVNDIVGMMQKEIEDLNIWSMVRVRGPGLSSWTVLTHKPETTMPPDT